MKDIKIIDNLTLSAVNWTPIAFGGKAIHELVMQLRSAADCYIAWPTDVTKYITLKSGNEFRSDFEGRNFITPSLGDDLVTNGTFTGSADDWTVSLAEWTYAANAIDKDADGVGVISQDIAVTAGKCYKLTYDITAMAVASITPSFGGTSGTVRSATGSFVDYIIAANSTGDLIFTPADLARFTLDNVTLKEVTNYANAMPNMLLVLAAAATPVLEIFST